MLQFKLSPPPALEIQSIQGFGEPLFRFSSWVKSFSCDFFFFCEAKSVIKKAELLSSHWSDWRTAACTPLIIRRPLNRTYAQTRVMPQHRLANHRVINFYIFVLWSLNMLSTLGYKPIELLYAEFILSAAKSFLTCGLNRETAGALVQSYCLLCWLRFLFTTYSS